MTNELVTCQMNGQLEECLRLKALCLQLCSDAISEVKRDILSVDTKTITRREDFSTQATVGFAKKFSEKIKHLKMPSIFELRKRPIPQYFVLNR